MAKSILFSILFVVTAVINNIAQCPKLVWSDEFNENNLDLKNWSYQIGDGCDINLCGWGNNELQYYQSQNAVVSNGTLKIIARREQEGNR
nr:hypothetical protein [Saprospiraceae bacterium]